MRRRRQLGNLRAKQVDKLIRRGKLGKHYDGLGLRLEIKGPNSANWVARYQIDGVTRYMGLGSARVFDLMAARERNRKLVREKLADGIDPVVTRRAERAARRAAAAKAMTFTEATKRYLQDNKSKWGNVRHAAQWEVSLRTYALPILGGLPVADIDVPLVLKVLEQQVPETRGSPRGHLWGTRTETASRLRGRIENILDWCKARQLRDGDNPASWAIIGKILPRSNGGNHHAALPYKEIPEFMAKLRKQPSLVARALEFCVLNAVRTGEVQKARWDEIDLEAAVWAIPPSHTKTGREHRVPLTDAVVCLLRDLPREQNNAFVFIGRPGGGLRPTQLLEELKRLRPDVTTHGFRSSFRDWAGELTAFAHDIAEAALAHVRGDKSVRAYARGDLFEKRRQLMDAWSRYCATPTPAAEAAVVTPIGAAR
jgi:integrase